ncbi:DUF4301 family protein [Ekhidna sp.]|uniref:DUF4301 family protein n=1 Tax=Ekhidna sp. TaxID=2608089 RepID=UPI003BA8D9D5
MFTTLDKNQITQKGYDLKSIEAQLERFKNGFTPLQIADPAIIDFGILKLDESEKDSFITKYDKADLEAVKFVPASGAATRMFKPIYSFIEKFDQSSASFETITREDKKIGRFFSDIDEFAFYDDLEDLVKNKTGQNIDQIKREYMHDTIAKLLVSEEGLNYGNLPKGLLKFHKYEKETRTAAQEHVYEGIAYVLKNGKVDLHFTVSPEHLNAFKAHIQATTTRLENSKIISTFSIQKPETDTIAVTEGFEPFRDQSGKILFRPAGHGAILENLNDISADLIFVKNIDNVVPDYRKNETIRFKKALAGLLLSYQEKSFELLRQRDSGEDITKEGRDLLEEMGIKGFSDSDIPDLLNRPIRVCGMVKNEGEPGGGPFWVKNGPLVSLQIVESAQVDINDKAQRKIFKKGTHFNPVDLVCGVRNYKGGKFELLDYRDEEAGFISEKSFNGRKLLAMELPGLWNGSMSNWNTIFVEVPLITFNPVKTVTDLLKPTHR